MTERTWILIKGLGHEREQWQDFAKLMEAQFPNDRWVFVDLPGAGVHYQEKSPRSIEGLLQSVRQDAAAEHPGPYHLLGISLGAMTAYHWARRYPDEVENLVLINTSLGSLCPFYRRLRPHIWWTFLVAALSSDPVKKETLTLSITSRREDLMKDEAFIQKRSAIMAKRPVTFRNFLAQLTAAVLCRGDASPPKPPTLILSGAGDALCHPCCSEAMARRWSTPHKQHPWAGHDLTLDDPEWVINQISAWLLDKTRTDGSLETNKPSQTDAKAGSAGQQ